MKNKSIFFCIMLTFAAMTTLFLASPSATWALTQSSELCLQCHIHAPPEDVNPEDVNIWLQDRHHRLGEFGGQCMACHEPFTDDDGIFLPRPYIAVCIRCHDLTGGSLDVTTDHGRHVSLIGGDPVPIDPTSPGYDKYLQTYPPPSPISSPESCETCHTDGVPGGEPVREPYSDSCATANCHAFNGPGQATHDLHTVFNPDCNTCHGPDAPVCVECHAVPANNVPGLFGHAFQGGSGSPSHVFHLTQPSLTGNCTFCHKSGVPGVEPVREPYADSCAPCHAFNGPGQPRHDLHTNFNPDCNTCHGPDAPVCAECHNVPANGIPGLLGHDFRAGPGSPSHDFHTGFVADCTRCHKSGVPGVEAVKEPYANSCAPCHAFNGPGQATHDLHTGLNPNCATCHGPEAPVCVECHDVPANGVLGLLGHDFRTGPGAPSHDFHTGFIPDCTRCHTSSVPGLEPVKEPYAGSCAPCHGFNGPGQLTHDLHTGFNLSCLTCHGSEAPVCVQCHDVPANGVSGLLGHDFRAGPGSPSHDFHSAFIPDCTICHKTEVPNPGPVPEPYTNSCAPCHAFNGPGQTTHDLHTDINPNCATCHGPEAPVCVECHQVPANNVEGLLGHDFRFGPGAPSHDFHTNFIGDCETCHISGTPDVTQIHEVGNIDCTGCHYTNLLPQHESDCGLCHGSTSSTVQDAIADGTIECQACHSEMPHAMDCMLCHNDENFNNYLGSDSRRIHDEHMDKTACGVCHEIPSNTPQQSCGLCHRSRSIDSARSVHKKHLRRFDNVARPCFWCHGLETPATPANVCDLCHSGRSGDRITAHDRHGEDFLCTICHDSVAGFGFDVRTGTPRDEVCTVCHRVRSDDFRKVHDKHLDEAQCFTCHGRSNVYAKLRGNLDCSICHGYESDSFRKVHREHVGDGAMCAVCHRVTPPSVQGVNGENSIPGYGTQPETEPGPPTPGPGEGLDDGKDGHYDGWGGSYDGWMR